MATFARALAFATVAAVLSVEALAKAHSVSEIDAVSMLQATVKDKVIKADEQQMFADEDSGGAHAYPEDVCNSCAAGSQAVSQTVEQTSPSVVQAFSASSEKPVEAKWEDPPGAKTCRILLVFMTLCVVLHGMRRWHLEQPEEQDREASGVQDEALSDMVKAAAAGDVSSFKKAFMHRPPVNREDVWGCTPLHVAAIGGSTEIVTELLSVGAKVDAIDACDETALHFAARAGHPYVCDALLQKGADINAVNAENMTPLVVAGHAKQASTCRLLIDKGAAVGGMPDEALPSLVVTELARKILEG
jgi:hypothetical protein